MRCCYCDTYAINKTSTEGLFVCCCYMLHYDKHTETYTQNLKGGSTDMVMMHKHTVKRIYANSTDKKVTIKRRGDGVYDIYVDDIYVASKGSVKTVTEYVSFILLED